MFYRTEFTAVIEQIDCAAVAFELRLVEDVDLPPAALLQLRRELSGVLKTPNSGLDRGHAAVVKPLLFPEVSTDPLIRRQSQKPSAAVVFSPSPGSCGFISNGERITLPAFFVGDGIVAIDALTAALRTLGEKGIHNGKGRFEITPMERPKISPLAWLIESTPLNTNNVVLEFITPIRLIKNGKPMFKVEFNDLFSAIVRRVTGMLAAHGSTDVSTDDFTAGATEFVQRVENRLVWQDWRRLQQGRQGQKLGGLIGRIMVSGEIPAEAVRLMQIGSLLNLGKGAAYGWGQYRLMVTGE